MCGVAKKKLKKNKSTIPSIKNPYTNSGPGNHQLSIETGRHTIPKTPENLGICPFC